MVLEGVENMGSTGGIRAISLAFAQNWSGPAVWRGRVLCRAETAAAAAAPSALLCLCVLSRFFVMSGFCSRRDVAKRIMGKRQYRHDPGLCRQLDKLEIKVKLRDETQ